jgi:NAD(P)-dependent dehydrogenase (short-subunit alcohol dehydrogenase family)
MTQKIYAITGGATGIGAAIRESLVQDGHKVIVIDIVESDIKADLSRQDDRSRALEELGQLAPEGLDGFIPCAGLGPHVQPWSLIVAVNFFGAVSLLEGVYPMLEKNRGAIVVIGSNSAPLPGLDDELVNMMLAGKEDEALEKVNTLDGHNAYAGSKRALLVWMRRHAPDYMRKGVRMNGVAPGITRTPLTDKGFEDESYGQAMKDFLDLTPYGEIATPDMIASSVRYLLDDASAYVVGSVLFVDGGADAVLRADSF